MGIVYRARHRRMDRLVALKTMTDRATESDDSVQRFQREVRAAARLSHPNIVAAYDAGEHNETHYLVMELVDGIDLSKLVRQSGPLNASRAVDYVRQAAVGFAYAHTQGIIHRDIKPQNLLVDRNQHVRILDMGLARLNPTNAAADPTSSAGAQTELTQSGVIMGTVDFMSPEQATNTRNANEQSDIYSLGCTLYFLMTGRAMFDGETCMERLLAHHQDSRPSLVATLSKIPPALESVFARMTARQPSDRYESMGEVVEALESVQSSFEGPDQDASPVPAIIVGNSPGELPEFFVDPDALRPPLSPATSPLSDPPWTDSTKRLAREPTQA
jgi:serine/threonine protein kinase